MKAIVLRSILVLMCGFLLTSAYHRAETASTMAGAAQHFLNGLDDGQRKTASFEFKDEERLNWHFIPRERKGLPYRLMQPEQRHLANALLSAGLSADGLMKATTIMSLEEVLRVMENDGGERRNPDKYYFSVFGSPGEKGVWGWRVEGHHLALNYTVVEGKVSGSPSFLGSNPAEVREGPRKGLRVLGREEDFGRELLTALGPELQKTAIVDSTAYPDILTTNARKASIEGQPPGLSAAKMTAAQRDMLHKLIAEYAHLMPEQVAQARMERVRNAGTNINFAWAGARERGGPHYYRVHGPTFLIEYDNTQNNANHIHSVWRDYNGDFGDDLLQQHYKTSHSGTATAAR